MHGISEVLADAYRDDLRQMAEGIPAAEAAIERMTDTEVIAAMERIMAVAESDDDDHAEKVIEAMTHKSPPLSGENDGLGLHRREA